MDSSTTQPGAPRAVTRPLLVAGRPADAVRQARRLAWVANAWHAAEFGIALGAGVAAGSIALVGFGIDSLIEAAAGLVILWRLGAHRVDSALAERRAQQLVAAGFGLLAAYVGTESIRTFLGSQHPDPSWVGIGLAAFTAPAMPLLARAKRRLGQRLGSSAAVSEAEQNMLCAYLSVALLTGLVLNAAAGWWWADPAAALVIAAVALGEGVSAWRGKSCDCC